MYYKIIKKLSTLLSTLLIFTSFGTLLSLSSSTISAKAILNYDETSLEQNNSLGYKFGDRFENYKAPLEKLKNDICGSPIDLTKNKYNPTVGASVLKTLTATCIGVKSNWVKLVFDNGLIAWTDIVPTTTVSNLPNWLNHISHFGSISASAAEDKKTCKDFQFRIYDLRMLNQYPNLDKDDDGVGCENLPAQTGKSTTNDQLKLEFLSKNDINKDSKISCADYTEPVIDAEILAIIPTLDGDSDGVGCEGLAPSTSSSTSDVDGDDSFPNMELEENKLQNEIDWSSLGFRLKDVLILDFQTLTGLDADCNTFDFGCRSINSLAGMGRRGLWLFKYTVGLLQGAGEAVVGVLKQILDLLTNLRPTVDKIIKGFNDLINNPSLLAKLFADQLDKMLKLDTFERAAEIGKVMGSIIPDIVVGALTAGVGAAGLKALEAIGASAQIVSKTIAVGKFVGKTVKLLAEGLEFQLVKIGSKAIGFGSKTVSKLLKRGNEPQLEKLYLMAKNVDEVTNLKNIKLRNDSAILTASNEIRFTQSTAGKNFNNGAGAVDDLSKDLVSLVKNADDIPPIDAVIMPDGKLTSVDNRRLVAFTNANKPIKSINHGFDEIMPDSFKYDYKTGKPRFKFKNGTIATTYGEAIKTRIIKQNEPPNWSSLNPNGSYELPKLK